VSNFKSLKLNLIQSYFTTHHDDVLFDCAAGT